MPLVDHLDIPTKLIYLAAGTVEYHPVDLYKEVRSLRRTDETLRVVSPPLTASGNIDKGGGKKTPRLVTFNNGWRVVPDDVTHVLNVTGEQITDDGQSGPACFDLTPLSATSKVIIQYEPPAAEVILVSTGGVAISDVQAGLTAQGYTTSRAPNLDNLDGPVSGIPDDVWLHAAAAKLQEGMTLLGMDPAITVEHGETYIRAPPDGSLINIKLTKVRNTVVKQRL